MQKNELKLEPPNIPATGFTDTVTANAFEAQLFIASLKSDFEIEAILNGYDSTEARNKFDLYTRAIRLFDQKGEVAA